MQLIVILLLVVALVLLVVGLSTGSSAFLLGSVAVSVLAVFAVVRARQQRDARKAQAAALKAEAARVAADKQSLAEARAAGPSQQPAGQPAVAESPDVQPPALPEQPVATEPAVHPAAAVPLQPAVPSERAVAPELAVPSEPLAAAGTTAPLDTHGNRSVWVLDGHPLYHLPVCASLAGLGPVAVPLRQAVEDGFTPCARCDPDTVLAAN